MAQSPAGLWGIAGDATDSEFTARAGALTLLFVAGSLDRERLLELLETALSGGLLRPSGGVVPDDEEIAEDEEDEEEFELEEEAELEQEDGYGEDDGTTDGEYEYVGGRSGRDSSDTLGPYTRMRASSKGEEFLFVASVIKRWLRNCPDGPLELGLSGARALAPLVCCWSATVTHALAPEPLTVEGLVRAVQTLDRETVVEHLEAMERAGLAEAMPGALETRYSLTNWGREGIAPIIAAVCYERHYPEDDVRPPDVFDAEAAFQMALPLLRVPPELGGVCRLGVRIPKEEALVAGATVEVARGGVVSSSPLLAEDAETSVTGSPLDWCETVIDPAAAKLRIEGDATIARAMVQGLHEALFGELD